MTQDEVIRTIRSQAAAIKRNVNQLDYLITVKMLLPMVKTFDDEHRDLARREVVRVAGMSIAEIELLIMSENEGP